MKHASYVVTIYEQRERQICVEASSPELALDIVRYRYNKDEITLDADNSIRSASFETRPLKEQETNDATKGN